MADVDCRAMTEWLQAKTEEAWEVVDNDYGATIVAMKPVQMVAYQVGYCEGRLSSGWLVELVSAVMRHHAD